MAISSPDAEVTCLKNHYRNPYSSTTADDVAPDASATLEKLHSQHDEEQEHHGRDRHGGYETNSLSSPSTTSTTDQSHDSQIPSALPERVASRMSTSSVLTFPEGGPAAWLAVVGSFCAMMSIYGLINSSAVFESYFSEHQLKDYTSSQIGWIFSLYLFLVFFIGIQVGPVFDRHGPRWLVPTGNLFMVLSLMLLGFCTGVFCQTSHH